MEILYSVCAFDRAIFDSVSADFNFLSTAFTLSSFSLKSKSPLEIRCPLTTYTSSISRYFEAFCSSSSSSSLSSSLSSSSSSSSKSSSYITELSPNDKLPLSMIPRIKSPLTTVSSL
ncbi:hypothetical protein D7V94_12645 [Parablautia intestinalis]|uniref:Uncharacterized protein n=1 Tax=Parablautia intestinalis TaxID=2320100 RepID=A0A3A9ATV3_9FIRM|nr:hypothetical protein D7V94_12645 [Parablautia intestinalis]